MSKNSMLCLWIGAAVTAGVIPLPAMAQGLTFTDPVTVFGPPPGISYAASIQGGTPVTLGRTFVPAISTVAGQTSDYIAVGDLIAASANTRVTPNPATAANSAALVTIASRLDRFAVSFGGAGYDGTGAGSVAISARIDESTLAYIGYARGPTQNLVKGGVGFSFR